jgi:phosphotransferase system enzyme I (PtsI)
MSDTTPPVSTKPERRFQGLAVSPGIAIGNAFVRGSVFVEPDRFELPEGTADAEIARFDVALSKTREQIESLQTQVADAAGGRRDASIFDAHLLVLEDRSVLDEVTAAVCSQRLNIEAAFYLTMSRYIEAIRAIDDPYLRERVIDIEDVMQRVLRNLGRAAPADYSERHPHLLVAHVLTPSDTAAMDREQVIGFATEVGSYTSHTAIIARSMGLPAVVGLHGFCELVHTGGTLLLDGYNGLAILDPSPETLAGYEELAAEKDVVARRLDELRDSDAETRDGRAITLSANIEFAHETAMTKQSGARGIGLYRTEFFYLHDGASPGEEQQTKNYTRVAKGVDPDGVIIRTMDIGGDKLPEDAEDAGENPFLGWRGIRVSLDRTHLFKTQLRAILRASAVAKVRVMFPMVSTLDELLRAKGLLAECEAELRDEGIDFDEKLEVGVMIEVPSAALIADQLAGEVDFFSVGTNDLVQYTLAVDRVNERVADLYQPLNPAVIRLLDMTVKAGHAAGIWVGVCGEMAADILVTPLLLGLGLDEFSVAAPRVPAVKHAIRSLTLSECEALTAEALVASDPADILASCRKLALSRYPELLT